MGTLGGKAARLKAANQLSCYGNVIQTSPQPSPKLGEGAELVIQSAAKNLTQSRLGILAQQDNFLMEGKELTSLFTPHSSLKQINPLPPPRRGNSAFTLAEVLITLGIIGVVAAITMPSLITNIQNKGYAEKLKKSYSLISQTTNLVSEDMGTEPKYWVYSHYTDGDEHDSLNRNILDAYKKHLQVVKEYTTHYNEYGHSEENKALSYRYLNGEANAVDFYSRGEIFCVTYVFKLADGTTMGLTFSNNKGGGVLWGLIEKGIRIAFIVDVNGPAKPNQIGRDIFWFALYNDGKILPYDINDTSECTKDGKGYSCAARIINEGKMNY